MERRVYSRTKTRYGTSEVTVLAEDTDTGPKGHGPSVSI